MAISPPAYDATRSPNEPDLYFYERRGCPFCGERRTEVLNRIRYHETAEAIKELPDIEGSLLHCRSCGVAYSSHGCTLAAFAKFYQKSFMDLSFLNESLLQKLRKSYLKGILSEFYRPFSASRFLNALSFNVLQAPAILTRPKGLNILDVGCGFGEFMDIYRGLGNRVTGTEVIPDLVQCVRDQGMECHLGAVEEVPLAPRSFDAVLLRAVFYRTQDPARTLNHVKSLLSPNGQIALIDPSPSLDGVLY